MSLSKNNTRSSAVLGTAQIGMIYGVNNTAGIPDFNTVVKIVQEAWTGGVREFDTAQCYGNSERVLGAAFAKLNISEKVRVISKIDPELDHLNADVLIAATIALSIFDSLNGKSAVITRIMTARIDNTRNTQRKERLQIRRRSKDPMQKP